MIQLNTPALIRERGTVHSGSFQVPSQTGQAPSELSPSNEANVEGALEF